MSKHQHLPLADSKKKTDARVRRTRDALGDALIALMQDKPFDMITVQDVLEIFRRSLLRTRAPCCRC